MRRVVWVGLALGLLACGGDSANKKIDAWGRSWYHAKRCIFGEGASFRNPKAALIQRQLSDPKGYSAIVDCVESMTPLSEGSAPKSSLKAEWQALVDTVPRAISVIEDSRKGAGGSRGDRRKRLAELIVSIDDKYAALCKAAGMAPPPPPKARAREVTDAPGGTVISARGKGELIPKVILKEGSVITVQGSTDTGTVIAVVRGPSKIERFGVASGITRAMKGAPWGVFKDASGSLRAGAIDEHGDPQGKGALVAKFKVPGFKRTFKLEPILAAGRGAWRAVVYDRYFSIGVREMWLSVSKNGGKRWPKGIRIRYKADQEIGVTASWAMGHAHITWDHSGTLHWLPVSETTLSSLLLDRSLRKSKRSSAYHDSSCLSDSFLWWISEGAVIRAGHGGTKGSQILSWSIPGRFDGQQPAETYCDDKNLARVMKRGHDARVLHCRARGCGKPMVVPDVGERPSIGFQGDQIVIGNVVEDHLVLWRSKTGPLDAGESPIAAQVAYRLAPGTGLATLVTWNGQLHAVLRTAKQARIVLLPPARLSSP